MTNFGRFYGKIVIILSTELSAYPKRGIRMSKLREIKAAMPAGFVATFRGTAEALGMTQRISFLIRTGNPYKTSRFQKNPPQYEIMPP